MIILRNKEFGTDEAKESITTMFGGGSRRVQRNTLRHLGINPRAVNNKNASTIIDLLKKR